MCVHIHTRELELECLLDALLGFVSYKECDRIYHLVIDTYTHKYEVSCCVLTYDYVDRKKYLIFICRLQVMLFKMNMQVLNLKNKYRSMNHELTFFIDSDNYEYNCFSIDSIYSYEDTIEDFYVKYKVYSWLLDTVLKRLMYLCKNDCMEKCHLWWA